MISLTTSRAGSLHLASDEVHCWCVNLDVPPETTARLYANLTADERNRGARFRFQRDRQRFVVAHGVLRDLLGRYLETPPGRIRFVYNASDKPDLGPEFGGRVKFNLSHSFSLALIAVAARSDCGVDVEQIRADFDYAEIARRFFSDTEVNQLSALPEPLYAEAFLSCWTKKEAYLKARGRGLAIPLNSFSVPLEADQESAPVSLPIPPRDTVQTPRWSAYTLRPAPGYLGALVVEGDGWRLGRWPWNMRRG